MTPIPMAGAAEFLDKIVLQLTGNPQVIAALVAFTGVTIYLRWKWFYVPALTLFAILVVAHYTFSRANIGEASLNMGYFFVGIILVVVAGIYFLLIKE